MNKTNKIYKMEGNELDDMLEINGKLYEYISKNLIKEKEISSMSIGILISGIYETLNDIFFGLFRSMLKEDKRDKSLLALEILDDYTEFYNSAYKRLTRMIGYLLKNESKKEEK
ncbi:MAG: hypothetical protein ACTSRP_07410 [Candidatus Helarchaeota archaeon]